MCGRYALRQIGKEVLDHFHIRAPNYPDLFPRFNAAPMQMLPVVVVNEDGLRALQLMRWGLVPSWTTGNPKVKPINARDDTVATSAMFRGAFKKHRCLVPADGYFEWTTEGKSKQPYLFEVDGGRLFGFAGLFEQWTGTKDTDALWTFATITTTANAVAATVHDRMPVILRPADWDRWLDPAFTDAGPLLDMLKPLPDRLVSVRRANPR